MRFEFATATRIIFGPGTLREVPSAIRGLLGHASDNRLFVVTGKDPTCAHALLQDLEGHEFRCTVYPVSGEPTVEAVRDGTRIASDHRCDLVVAMGGGSAIDAGKAIAALLTNREDPLEYLEVIGAGRPLTHLPKPFVALPTTAGTGAEVTRNAVLASQEHRVKVSLRSPAMLPALAVVDPEGTCDLPRSMTAATGLDALTQLIEAFVCLRANPMTDAFCRDGLARVGRSLRQACDQPRDLEARGNMSLGALMGGLALANAGLGAVHGLAGPLGGMFSAPHGAICAVLLPDVMAANLQALRSRQPESDALNRYEETAQILLRHPDVAAEDGVEWVRQLVADLSIPPLSTYGVTNNDLEPVIRKAAVASSMKPNPIQLSDRELESILTNALS